MLLQGLGMWLQIQLPDRPNYQVPWDRCLKVSITSLVGTAYDKSQYEYTE